MPAKYKGRAEIDCRAEICIEDPARENVIIDCLDCEFAVVQVIDLAEKPIKDVPVTKIKITPSYLSKQFRNKKKED